MFLGVCDWLGPKVGVEAKILRIIFLVAVIFFGVGIAAYLILWLVKLISG